MIKDLVLHLGDCKTGTTSIQTVLAEGRCTMQRSFTYPTASNHIPLTKALQGRDKALVRQKFGELNRYFRNSDAEIGIISSEHFEFIEPGRVAATLERHMPDLKDKVRLIAYVRPHAERLLAGYAERTKLGNFSGTLADLHLSLAEKQILDYTPRFRKWREIFGDAFTLRPMITTELKKNDVVHDFLSYVAGGDGYSISGPTRVNESLSLQSLAVLRLVQDRIHATNPDLAAQQKHFGRTFARLLSAGGGSAESGARPALHKDLAEAVIARYCEDAKALDAEFFQGTPMTAALLRSRDKAVETEQSARPEDYLGPEALAQHQAWADLTCRMMSADPAAFQNAIRTVEYRERTRQHRAAMRPKRRARAED